MQRRCGLFSARQTCSACPMHPKMAAPRLPPARCEYSHALGLPLRTSPARCGSCTPRLSPPRGNRHGNRCVVAARPLVPRPWASRRRSASAFVDAIMGVSARPATSRRAINGDCVSLSGPLFSSRRRRTCSRLDPVAAAVAARVRSRRALDQAAAPKPGGASQVGGGAAEQAASVRARARARGERAGGSGGGAAAAVWPDLPGAAGAPRGGAPGGGRARAESCRPHFLCSPPALSLPLRSPGPCPWAKSAT